jgi:hypothetical protein
VTGAARSVPGARFVFVALFGRELVFRVDVAIYSVFTA